jgi:hypothetical protein
MHEPVVFTVGHGVRPVDELVETLFEAKVQTLIDETAGSAATGA